MSGNKRITRPDELKPVGWAKKVIDVLDPMLKALDPLVDLFGAATPYVLYFLYCAIVILIFRLWNSL